MAGVHHESKEEYVEDAPAEARKNQLFRWIGTQYNIANPEDVKLWCRTHCSDWGFQLERCPTSQRLHYQIGINLTARKRLHELVNMCKDSALEGCHWTPVSTPGREKASTYCMKPESRVDGPWTWKMENVPWQLKNKTPWPWQQRIIDMLQQKEDRGINFLYDPTGSIGKSTLFSWCLWNGICNVVPPLEKTEDLIAAAMAMPEKNFMIDIPRAFDHTNKKCKLYGAIEALKSGYYYDKRNTWKHKQVGSPQIWVYSNTFPRRDGMTSDRWHIWMVDADKELIEWSIKVEAYMNGWHKKRAREIAAEKEAKEPVKKKGKYDDLPVPE